MAERASAALGAIFCPVATRPFSYLPAMKWYFFWFCQRRGLAPAVLVFVFGSHGPAHSQVKTRLTARVDTTQKDTKAVYTLLGQYFNARPDSAYANLFWNAPEVAYHVEKHQEKVDMGAIYA